MIKRKLIYRTVFVALLSLGACSSDNDPAIPSEPDGGIEGENPKPQALDLYTYKNGSGVMMQTFYWDVEPRGDWWNIINDKVDGWAAAGVDRLWLPVATKGQSGGYSMGYDPSDYFDFGEYNQHGTTETRFGSKTELESLISNAHGHDMEVIADIVINHNSGGGLEYNPFRDKEAYTLFDETHGNASGMFNRTYEDFYPNSVNNYLDNSLFYEETNLDHHREHVKKWLWEDENSVAKYYQRVMKFDGWRFDYVQGFSPDVIKQWMAASGPNNFAVAENYDGNALNLINYVDDTGISAFDFACFYRLEEALDRNNDLSILGGGMLRKTYPNKAVTFTANHDTEKDTNKDNNISAANKMKAYAYILTHDGYPTIFYSDYENSNFQDELKNLILIHNSLATGDVEVLFNDNDEYIMKRKGTGINPGIIFYMNTSSNTKRREVNSTWNGKQIMDYSSNTSYSSTVGADGSVSIEAPANSYSIWSIME